MRVLLLFPMKDKQTGSAIQRAFENLGHKVQTVDAKIHPGMSYNMACKFKPDLIFCSRTTALTDQLLQIKKAFSSAITCVWNVDTRDTLAEWSHLFPLIRIVDYYFVVGSRQLSEWRSKLNAKTFWLSQGVQDEIYNRPRAITYEDRQKYACDVCFCGTVRSSGNYYWDRPSVFKAIEQAGFNFNLWGGYGNPQVRNEEHNKQAVLAKVNLGISGWPNAGKYVSVRDYKIMGAGGFLLERCGDGLGELFPLNGKEKILDCFSSTEELVEKIRHWLTNDEDRKRIAEEAYKWIHANSRYTNRIKKALEIMGL